ncbi:helix-turn-helix domain-containing protein [Yinghuangia sp. YIM S09857]|uniref:helix-turn-helix domain-containing protein n=1 Tax=Yinghuangia sp. YIM S09857 TaxID=3436929 RepID=UPI003F5312F3
MISDETAGTRRPRPEVVARNVRARRDACALSTAEVADAAGLSEAWVRDLEAGQGSLTHTALTRLATALATTPGTLASEANASDLRIPPEAGQRASTEHDLRRATEICEEESYARLALHNVGRVASPVGAAPFILPVNYVVDGKDIVFRTHEGSSPASVHGVAAFEVDDLVPTARLGWSVLVIGEAARVVEPTERERLADLGLTPWPDDEHDVWIRIRPTRVTGRRISPRIDRTPSAD